MTDYRKKGIFRGNAVGRKRAEVIYVPIGRIIPSQTQIRKCSSDDGLIRLSDSIMRYGILQPLTVRAAENSAPKKRSDPLVYELIAGERRLKAAKMAGLTEVPCMVVEANDRQAAELMLVENVGREALTYFDEASAMAFLIDVFCLTQEETAGVFGVTRSTVSNKLRLLRLTAQEKMVILAAGLSERHARLLLKICDSEKRLEVLKEVTRTALNVPQTEELIDRVLCPIPEDTVKSKRKMGIKDARIVYNTIDRAIESIEKSGIPFEKERKETADFVEFVIRIKKTPPLKPRNTPELTNGVIENPRAV